jgi:hypothetical protein
LQFASRWARIAQVVHVAEPDKHWTAWAELDRGQRCRRARNSVTKAAYRYIEQRAYEDADGGLVSHEHHSSIRMLSLSALHHGQRARRNLESGLSTGGRMHRRILRPGSVGLGIARLNVTLFASLPRAVSDLT